ncbi:MAG: MBL fold metallo-hydrolase [candidate division Zixibacteria bacterium]|nr:MBL fold metallo-hydrolase [candidate division Zixibacteria bacterium]
MMRIHFVDVGQGNMVVVVFPDNTTLVYDCNITSNNSDRVEKYLAEIMPKQGIDVFVNSHRDADHMRGLAWLHSKYPIGTIWDSGVPGNQDAPEYQTYMRVKRRTEIASYEIEQGQTWSNETVRILNGKRGVDDTNSQSIVLQLKYQSLSVMLAGDTDAAVWRNSIVPSFGESLNSVVLYASHHGSDSFFDDPNGYGPYTEHMEKISPQLAVVSVGKNSFGHPDREAMSIYDQKALGADDGTKLLRTDEVGSMTLDLMDGGRWQLSKER